MYSDLPWRKTLLTMLTVKVHDSEVYRLPHPKSLSTSLLWETQKNPEESAAWAQRLWSWKAHVKTLESYLVSMPISHKEGRDCTWRDLCCSGTEAFSYGIPDGPVGHSPQGTQPPRWENLGEEQGSCCSLRKPLRSQLSASNTAQSSISLLLTLSELNSRRQMPTFASTPELSDQGPSVKEGVHLPVPAGMRDDGVACLPDLSSSLFSL